MRDVIHVPAAKIWDKAADFFQDKIIKPVKRFFTVTLPDLPDKVMAAIRAMPRTIARAIGFAFGYIWQQIKDGFDNVKEWWNSWTFEEIWNNIKRDFIDPAWEWITGLSERVTEWWNSWTFEGIWNNIKTSFIDPIWEWITGLPDRVTEWWNSWTFEGIWNSIKTSFIDPVWNWVTGLPTRVTEWWNSWSFADIYTKFYDSLIKPVEDWFQAIPDKVKGWWKSFTGWFSEGSKEGADAAKQSGGLIEGTYDGRVDNIRALVTAGEWVTRKRVVDKPMAKMLLADLNEERINPADFYAALNLATAPNVMAIAAPTSAVSPVGAGTVVNNTRNSGLSTGDIHIHNPVREKSDQSLRRTLHTVAFRLNR